MNSLEKLIMEEISSLEELRLIDVLGFIRYLKEGKSEKPKEMEIWFEERLQEIRKHNNDLVILESK